MKINVLIFMVALLCLSGNAYSNVSIFCPEDIDLGCNPRNIPKPKPNKVDYRTDCKKAKVKHVEDVIIQDGCSFILKRYYLLKDDCGDEARCVQTIKWTEDKEPPAFLDCDFERDLGCNASQNNNVPPADPSALIVTDNCGVKEVVFLGDTISIVGCKVRLVRGYRAFDHCGNSSDCTQVFTWLEDNDPPVANCKDIDLGCNPDKIPEPDPESVRARDRCCIDYTVHLFDSDIIVFGCQYSMLRYYEVADCCGNKDTCYQSITWTVDNIPPVIISCAPNEDLGCISDPGDIIVGNGFNQIIAEDNCSGDLDIELESSTTNNDGCNYNRVEVYKVSDACGNASFCTRVISYILDKNPPVIISCPPDLDLGCAGPNGPDIPYPTPDEVKYEDECEVEIKVVDGNDITVTDCTATFIRAYFVIDACGNSSVCEQRITWTIDTTPPVATCTDLDLGCNPTEIPEPDPDSVEARDQCCIDYKKYLFDSNITVYGCHYSMLRYYEVSDCCGNKDTCYQSITWTVDVTPPRIISCAPDLDLGCNPDPSDVIASNGINFIEAEDNCSGEVIIKFESSNTIIDECIYKRLEVYSVSDECGNTSYCTRIVKYVIDTMPPVIIRCPPDLYLGCPGPNGPEIPEPDINLVIYEDACNVDIEVINGIDVVVSGCTASFYRLYKLTDECGNVSQCEQVFTWTIDAVPTSVACPEGINYGCVTERPNIPEPDFNTLIIAENCGIDSVYTLEQLIILSDCEYILRRWIFVRDICGNTRTACFADYTWKIVGIDIPFPEDILVFCGDIPEVPEFGPPGDCAINYPVLIDVNFIGECATGTCTILYTWMKTDCAGNFEIHVQTVELRCELTGRSMTNTSLSEIAIYPNPGVDVVNLEWNSNLTSEYNISVMDINGKILLNQNFNGDKGSLQKKLDTSNFIPGMYIIKLTSEDEQVVKRWIKTK